MAALLEVANLEAFYGATQVLHGFSFGMEDSREVRVSTE